MTHPQASSLPPKFCEPRLFAKLRWIGKENLTGDGKNLLIGEAVEQGLEEIRRFALLSAVGSGQYERWKNFADSCMAEYDLDGWTVPDLITPDDINLFLKKKI